MLPFLVPSGCVAAEARGGARAAFQSFVRSHLNLGKKTRLVDMIDMFFFLLAGGEGNYACFLRCEPLPSWRSGEPMNTLFFNHSNRN